MTRRLLVACASFCVAVFALAAPASAQTGSITGTVTNASGGAGISGISVIACNGDSCFQGASGFTAATTGAYTISSLSAGTYRVYTLNNGQTFIDQFYKSSAPTVECGGCQPTLSGGSTVVVGTGATTGVNFSLRTGPRITGNVKDATTGAGLSGISINIYRVTGNWNGSFTSTDSSGNFTSGGMAPGIAFTVITSNSQGYVDRIYNNVTCIGGSCGFNSGGSITFATNTSANATANFSLEKGGQITGKMSDSVSTAGLTSGSLNFFNTSGQSIAFASPNGPGPTAGQFTSPGLPAGTYYVRASTFNAPFYIGQVYNGIECTNCNATTGTPVTVVANQVTPNINFPMVAAGSISGTITDATNATGIANASVQAYTTGGAFITSTSTLSGGSAGQYTLSGLPTGDYILRISGPFSNNIYITKVYKTAGQSYDCQNCDVTLGSPIHVNQGATTSGISVALNRGGTISGNVKRSDNAVFSGINVSVLNSAGSFIASANTDGSGNYSIGGLFAGTYYVRTNSSTLVNLIPEIWNGTLPANPGVVCISCPVSAGKSIGVVLGGTQTADFVLDAGATITGNVTSDTNAPVVGAFNIVQLFNNLNTQVTSVGTTGTGDFTFVGLPAGTYFVRTNAGGGLIDEVYNDITCVGCTATGGTPISVAAGGTVNAINFVLTTGGRITGRVVDQIGTPLASGANGFVSVSIYNSGGTFITSASTNASGVFLTNAGLPPGSYYAISGNGLGYINTLYDNISCFSCFAPTGSPIVVAAGNTTTINDLVLQPGGRIAGNVRTPNGSGGFNPVANVQVQVYSSSGSTVGSSTTNALGNYTVAGLPTDNYTVKTSAGSAGLVDQLYLGAPCLGCDVTSGTPISAVVGGTTTGIDFTLNAGGSISGKVTDAVSTQGLANVSVQIYNSTGGFFTSTSTLGDGTYVLRGLATGTYFLRTFNSLGYVNLLKGTPSDIICGTCTTTAGAPISVTSPSTTANVDFALSLGGSIRGQVTDGSTPLAGISISILNPSANGASVAFATTDSNGNYAATGIVPGTYLVKTSNSQGFIDEVFNNVECVNCTATAGDAQTISSPGQVISNINFALAPGGRIRGTVKDTSGNPLTGIQVEFYRVSGASVGSTTTNSQGTYVSGAGLPAGDYLVRTRNSQGYVDRVYNGITCVGCTVTTVAATTVTLAAGAGITLEGQAEDSVTTATNVDFALALGGNISGKVTAADGVTPIQGVFAQVYSSTGTFISSTSTNGLGNFIIKGLPTGNYFVKTSNSLGYIDQLFNGVPCVGCTVTTGAPVGVTVGATTAGINFSLTAGGRVGGIVTATGSGAPIQSVTVQIYNSAGSFVTSGFTSPAGTYVTGALSAGTYYARTFNSVGSINMLHASPSDIVCTTCTVTAGAPFTVTLGSTTTINFTLASGGSIAGRVSDRGTSTAIPFASVQVYTTTGTFITSGSSNASGDYVVGGLPTGVYTVRTSSVAGYVDQLYNDITCIGCTTSTGAPVSVTVGAVTSGINFNLDAGGLVSGTITDAGTGNPVANITVSFYNASGFFISSGTTDNLGRYITRQGMATGTYYAKTNNSIGYINLTYPSNACLNCPISVGSPIPVTKGQTTPNINFALSLGGRVTGTITDAGTGAALQGVSVIILLPDGTSVGSGSTNSLGVYTSPGLPAGTYYARTSNGIGYVNQVFSGVNCLRCTAAIGAPITVNTGAATSSVNFALTLGGRVSGTVRDAVSGLPLAGVSVTIVDGSNFSVTSATTNALGQYVTFAGLTTGTYYARTNNQLGYVNKLYDVFNCLGCNPSTGRPIAVTLGQTTANIDFNLSTGGRITGTVTGNGLGLPDAFIDVFSSGGTFLTSARTGTSGQYITGEGLPPGDYYLVSENAGGFVDELYNNNQCGFACAVTSGTKVTVVGTGTTAGIDFALAPGGRISGRITDSNTGVGLPNVSVDVFNSAGVRVAGGFTDGRGNYTTDGGLPTGTYRVQTFASSKLTQYVNEVYDNVVCAGCNVLTSGTGVPVTAGSVTTGIDFQLGSGEVLSGRVTDAATGLAISGAGVRVFSVSGIIVGGATADESGAWTMTSALPGGTYFARTVNGLGYVDRVYDTDICLACDVTRGTPIVVDGAGATTGINFALTAGGRISGVVNGKTGAGATVPVPGTKMRIFNSAGSFLGQVFTNGVGQYTTFGLPPGNYFVRTANTAGYIDQLYVSAPCVPCVLTEGTVVTVVNAGLRTGIDFLLDGGGLVSGYVRDQTTGAPIKGVTLSVYVAGTTTKVATTDPTDANGYYQISLPVGQYEVEPNPVSGFRPVIGAGLRRPAARSTVTVDTGTETTGVGFSMLACAPVTITPATLPLAAKGQSYGTTLTATGGTGPYTFSISDGNPNTGLALAASGSLAGTPVFAGTGNFTVAVSDANVCGGSQSYALTACSFSLSTSSLSATAVSGGGSVALTASTVDCPWLVSTSASWVTLTSAATGVGNTTVTFTYTANTSASSRTATVTIGGQLFTITQGGSTASPAFGVVDTPANGITGVAGSLALTGWALDDVEVKRVVISRAPVAGEGSADIYIGDATFVDGARPDVAAGSPTLPFSTRAGWGYLLLTNMLPNQGNGAFTLYIDAIDAENNTTRLGSRTFTGDNANSVQPFGAIDTPQQGATISGAGYVNFGWALTPNPKSIAADGSTITVFIDGAPAGNPTYNNFRPDVAALFPGLVNSNGAIAFKFFDTTTWTNGVHSISWIVSDSAGKAEGIGSRYFTVNNTLASIRIAPPLASMRASAAVMGPTSGPTVTARMGFGRSDLPLELKPDAIGNYGAALGQLGRIELRFGGACGAVTATQIVDGERVKLPVGSTLDGSSFVWMPGPAFLGEYQLEFTVPGCSGGETKIPVSVTVLPGR